MTHIFKVCGQNYLYDSLSHTTHKISPLIIKMLDMLKAPLTKHCPTHIRYALAMYDSKDVNEAYNTIYDLYTNNYLFNDNLTEDKLVIEEDNSSYIDYSPNNGDKFSSTIIEMANSGNKAVKIDFSKFTSDSYPIITTELEKLIKASNKGEISLKIKNLSNDYIKSLTSSKNRCDGCWAKAYCSQYHESNTCKTIQRIIELSLANSHEKSL